MYAKMFVQDTALSDSLATVCYWYTLESSSLNSALIKTAGV